MIDKRIIIVSGHYGSGKTNIALNFAYEAKKKYEKVTIADIDIVNPYFRTKDSEKILEKEGIRLICSEYANTNIDIPALPQEIYAITDDKSHRCILDVGGDERGALALGRIAPAILSENDYEMIYVINKYRPLTKDVESAYEVMLEIEAACRIKFTSVVNNSNLGAETVADDVVSSLDYARAFSEKAGLPLLYTSVSEKLYSELYGKVEGIYKISLQKTLI